MSNLAIEGLSGRTQIGDGFSRFQIEKQQGDSNSGVSSASDAKHNAKTFSDILKNSVEQVNEHQVQADTAMKELVSGRTKNVHETMLAVERADVSLKLMMQIRNKVLDAYKEIMRMQV
ncbi:flagellar hook-basal body complex protein FliE [Bdellovibrionota bacterium FG-2]